MVENAFDLILYNGTIFDGCGTPPVQCDIAIKNGKIACVAKSISGKTKASRNLAGLWVLPGFIDIHTHYDIEVEISPGLTESVQNGVTTVVMGNCSLSVTYGSPSNLADMFLRVETLPRILTEKWLKASVAWETPQEYFNHLSMLPMGPNVAALLGHSSLRAHVMGMERSLTKKASKVELIKMKELAEKAIDAGCIGISIDMVPWHMMSGKFRGRTIPSQHANFREYRMLAEVCRKRDVVFQVTPNPQDLRSVWAILWMSLGIVRRPLRVTILAALDSVAYPKAWRLFPSLLFFFNRLLKGNIRFQTLTEPFTVYSDGPITPLFEEFSTGIRLNDQETRTERISLWKDSAFRRKFRLEWTSRWRNTFHRNLNLMKVIESPNPALIGKTFAEIAAEQKKDPLELFIELLEQFDTDIRWVTTGANNRQDIRFKLLSHSHILPGFTDAGAHVRNLGYYDGALSLIRQAVSTGFMAPEKAIERVTGEPERWFNLDRGELKLGKKADILVLDPKKIKGILSEQIEHSDPLLDGALRMVKRGAEEIESVYINGKLAVTDGNITDVVGNEYLGEVLFSTNNQGAMKRIDSRNKINDEIIDHPFVDYWDIFILKHQDNRNITLHCLGVLLNYSALVCLALTWNPWCLMFVPLSQVIGLLGHYLFERSHIDKRDAIFSFRAIYCLNKLFIRVVTGNYFKDISNVNTRLQEHLKQKNIESKRKKALNS